MKTYFITGGSGFVGFFITQELLKDTNNQVILYDAYKHYIPIDKSSWLKYQSYRILELDNYGERVVKIRGDVNDRGLLKESLLKYTPSVVIHLAAVPIASISNDYPYEAKNNILDSIVTLMDVLRETQLDIDRIMYASSSMVYGDFLKDENGAIIPAKEDQPCDPKGLYGSMKLAGEYIIKAYHKRFGIPYVIIRPSAVYGPTDCNKRVTEIFLTNALEGKELILDNGGLHQLDFTYVKDLARGFVLAATSEKALNNTLNITRGEGRSIKELAEITKSLIPEAKIVSKEASVYRPSRGKLDLSRAKEILGYQPQYSLEEGFKEYLDFVKNFNSKS